MITLHRLGHSDPMILNSDLLLTVEANPDTVITLITGARLVVAESPQEVVARVREWRSEVGKYAFGTPKLVSPKGHGDDHDPGPSGGLRTV